MEQFYQLAHAFMNHDLNTLSNPKMAFMICGVILTFLVLENGFIPTAFCPVTACCCSPAYLSIRMYCHSE